MAATLAPTTTGTLDHLGQMHLIRELETEAERQYKAARIGGYCHLSSGQEAATVGAVSALEEDDLLITGYRCHGFAHRLGSPAIDESRSSAARVSLSDLRPARLLAGR